MNSVVTKVGNSTTNTTANNDDSINNGNTSYIRQFMPKSIILKSSIANCLMY